MTFKTTINSTHRPKDFLRRGIKSMFSNYVPEAQSGPPSDTEDGKKRAEKNRSDKGSGAKKACS